MPRKPTVSRASSPASLPVAAADTKRSPSLANLRAEIDRIDKELVALLNRRAEMSLQIGAGQAEAGAGGLVARAGGRGPHPRPDDEPGPAARRDAPADLPRAAEQQPVAAEAACGSPAWGRSTATATSPSVAKFGEAVEHVPVGSIAAVFEEVNRRHVQFGIVPLENSTDGRIVDTLEMFVRLPGLKIRAEVRLRVHHCLLGRCEWGQVQRVYSKAQALSQCRHWLGKNLPQARIVDVVSTAAAAEMAQREEFAAAVASRPPPTPISLNVLAANIEDQPHNVTRFAVIAENSEQRTGKDKTTLMLRLPNEAGALSEAIAPFKKNGVNMTWIESFPFSEASPKGDPGYLFFVDIEGHADDDAVQQLARGRPQALRAARDPRLLSPRRVHRELIGHPS